ncbi:hypothetical protein T12_11980 [Trichinella patagoniensis]|uniref:Uncharacterized protein n=1 Tax=Trichinella patagoniensis TaxID=990121 RepID=A0A0V0WXD7_9BILA|nr:hypothetical protein T12_11980 [Trichinella patagoniensis]
MGTGETEGTSDPILLWNWVFVVETVLGATWMMRLEKRNGKSKLVRFC